MRFEYYHEPPSIRECIELLNHYGPDASVLAGGTDLVVKLRSGAAGPKAVISLGAVGELSKLEMNSDRSVSIGAMMTLRDVERADSLAGGFDVIRQGARRVSSMQVRNVATLGGNSCNASPGADTVPGLIASEANARIAGPAGERSMPLETFFRGPGITALGRGEILIGFHVPCPPPFTAGAYIKYAIRGDTDLAIVGVAARLTLDEKGTIRGVRIVLGAVAPTPIRARQAEDLLIGRPLGDELLRDAARAAAEDSRPISDQRATAQYRREMVRVWTRYALQGAYQKCTQENQGD